MKNNPRRIEWLSPARDLQVRIAAIDHGADAVYMGGSRFGARRAAANPTEEIMRATEYAHQYGVRLHATLNTTLFDDELHEAETVARELIAAGVDALIVQDMALRRMNLPVELHASTQVGNTTPGTVWILACDTRASSLAGGDSSHTSSYECRVGVFCAWCNMCGT